jgi:hypothetical protein
VARACILSKRAAAAGGYQPHEGHYQVYDERYDPHAQQYEPPHQQQQYAADAAGYYYPQEPAYHYAEAAEGPDAAGYYSSYGASGPEAGYLERAQQQQQQQQQQQDEDEVPALVSRRAGSLGGLAAAVAVGSVPVGSATGDSTTGGSAGSFVQGPQAP